MALFRIKSQNIANGTIGLTNFIEAVGVGSGGGGGGSNDVQDTFDKLNTYPIITSISIANSTYDIIANTVIDSTGGYIVVSGQNFDSNIKMVVGETAIDSANLTRVDSTTLQVALPAKNTGSYPIIVSNPTGQVSANVTGVRYSDVPLWITDASLSSEPSLAFTFNLTANSDSNITYSNTTTLPAGTDLLSNGYFYGSVTTAGTYYFEVIATDEENQESEIRNFSLEISASGQQEYTTPGIYSWTAPAGVTSVCVVCVGAGAGGGSTGGSGGGGGGGGGLGWKNNITVVPGQSYTVYVGAGTAADVAGTADYSYFINTSTVAGFGGTGTGSATGGTGGGYVGDGGGNGGSPDSSGTADSTGGGGAGGYSGNGGGSSINTDGQPGSGGGGGGGGAGGSSDAASGGGGVGIYGEGSSGAGGIYTANDAGAGGGGGSGGSDGGSGLSAGANNDGGAYGGGGGGAELNGEAGAGAGGAVRIIWGSGRAFPSTNTADV
jgi:hypothetical protein